MRRNYARLACGLALAVAFGLYATPASAQAIVTNGAGVAVGIKATGAMGVPNGTGPAGISVSNSGLVGLAFFTSYTGGAPNWRDATTPGCMCEGFGVSVNGTVAGFDSNSNGAGGLTVLDAGGTVVSASQYTTLVALSGMRHHDCP
jgi:hypothetical protein